MKAMTQAKTNLSINTKRKIDRLTKNWGMSTSTYLRMAIKQAIKDKTIPFKITTSTPVSFVKPNQITKRASREKGSKKYTNTDKLFKNALK